MSVASSLIDPVTRAPLVEAADRIGRQILRAALWDAEECTWQVTRGQRDARGIVVPASERANGTLYQGTAGIALFLAELYRVSGQQEVARAAMGALRFAVADAARLPPKAVGLYSGRLGIAYTAVRAGRLLGADLTDQAEEVLEPIARQRQLEPELDTISGAAGAIPALLWLARHLPPALTTELALRLGRYLLRVAQRRPGGWSWGALPSHVRSLCGYSHGASGFAHAFLELYAATGDGEYRYAAEQALRYEDAFLSAEEANWPDFRHPEVGTYVASGRIRELRERLARGDRPAAYEPAYPALWCHGAAGIGLVRLRAYQVLQASDYAEKARIAIRRTIASLSDRDFSFCLCHGIGGNCETLLLGAEVLRDPRLHERALAAGLEGVDRYHRAERGWPCGTVGGVPDPGLLTGEAGIGLFLLRLVEPAIESVLFLTAPVEVERRPGGLEDGYRRAQLNAVEEYFGDTLSLLSLAGVGTDELVPVRSESAPAAPSDVDLAFRTIAARIEVESRPELRSRLDARFARDRARYELAASPPDFAEEFLDSLSRQPIDAVDWDRATFTLAPRTRIVGPLASEVSASEGWPSTGSESIALRYARGRVAAVELNPLAVAVLEALSPPATLAELVPRVRHALGGMAGVADERIVETVRAQLVSAYRAGVIAEANRSAAPHAVRNPADAPSAAGEQTAGRTD